MSIEKAFTSVSIRIQKAPRGAKLGDVSLKYSGEVNTALKSHDYKGAAFALEKWAEHEERIGNSDFAAELRENSYSAYIEAGDASQALGESLSAVQSYMKAMRQISSMESLEKIKEAAKKASNICISEVKKCILEGSTKSEIEWYSRGKSVAELLYELESLIGSARITSLRRTLMVFALLSSIYMLSSILQIQSQIDIPTLRLIAKL